MVSGYGSHAIALYAVGDAARSPSVTLGELCLGIAAMTIAISAGNTPSYRPDASPWRTGGGCESHRSRPSDTPYGVLRPMSYRRPDACQRLSGPQAPGVVTLVGGRLGSASKLWSAPICSRAIHHRDERSSGGIHAVCV